MGTVRRLPMSSQYAAFEDPEPGPKAWIPPETDKIGVGDAAQEIKLTPLERPGPSGSKIDGGDVSG